MIITHYKLRIGKCREYKQYHEIEEGKGLVLLGDSSLQTWAQLFGGYQLFWLCFSIISGSLV